MYHFIVNIHGGSGKSFIKWNKIREILKERNVQYETHVPLRPGHASEIALKLANLQDEEIKLIILGGDGTINEVLNGIPIEKLGKFKLGLIPTGSGNDFSRGLNLPRHNVDKAIDVILNSSGEKRIDLGVIESDDEGALYKRRVFGISSGFGLDSIVGTSINKSKIKIFLNKIHAGKLSYGILTIKTLFSMETYRVRVKFDNEDEKVYNKVIYIASMNFKAEGGGVPMAPTARGDDGKLSVCLVHGVPKFLTFLMFPFLLCGVQHIFKSFLLRDYETMEIVSDTPSIIATDGELFGNVKQARYSIIKNALALLI